MMLWCCCGWLGAVAVTVHLYSYCFLVAASVNRIIGLVVVGAGSLGRLLEVLRMVGSVVRCRGCHGCCSYYLMCIIHCCLGNGSRLL